MTCQCGSDATQERPWVGRPELLDYGDYQRLTGSALTRNLRHQSYRAVSIGPQSQVDALRIRHEGNLVSIDQNTPLIGRFEDAIRVEPFYPQLAIPTTPPIDFSLFEAFTSDFQLQLWPDVPTIWPRGRGPDRASEVQVTTAQDAISPLGSFTIGVFPAFGRGVGRVFFANDTGAIINVRLAAVEITGVAAFREHALWPTAGDPSMFQAVAAGGDFFTFDTEGWQFIKAYTDAVATIDWSWRVSD